MIVIVIMIIKLFFDRLKDIPNVNNCLILFIIKFNLVVRIRINICFFSSINGVINSCVFIEKLS